MAVSVRPDEDSVFVVEREGLQPTNNIPEKMTNETSTHDGASGQQRCRCKLRKSDRTR